MSTGTQDTVESERPPSSAISVETRVAQATGGNGGAPSVNVTDFGAKYHAIEKGDVLVVETHEDGLLIRPAEQ